MAESTDITNVIDITDRLNRGELIVEATPPEGTPEFTEWTFTNDKTNPLIRQMFHMLYQGVFGNTIGVMHAFNSKTEKVDTLIVGLSLDEDNNVITWPMARVLTEEEQDNYLAPDGNGNWV